MGDEHTSDKRPVYRKSEQDPTVVCRDQNQLASMTLHAPNNNDPAHFKETGVYIETFFGEITHQYFWRNNPPIHVRGADVSAKTR